MADIQSSTAWFEAAASNVAATPDGWPEGMSYSAVNNCAREMMGAIKREWNRSHATLASTGTSTAYLLTYTTAPTYTQGVQFAFRAHSDCGASPTVNVNGLGALTLYKAGLSGYLTLNAFDIRAGQIVIVQYDTTASGLVVLNNIAAALADASNATPLSFRNRLINGDMRIDQRNAGAAVTTGSGYTVDRWIVASTQASKFSIQQVTSTLAGERKSLKATVTAAVTPGAADSFNVGQLIEGFNVADFMFGTSAAVPIAVSFRAKSSINGVFSGTIRNGATNRSYVFIFALVAGVDTAASVIIPGDTTGTWATDNTAGLSLTFDLGSGSNFTGASGAWTASNRIHATASANLIANAGATFEFGAVQLERVSALTSQATPFERRSYGVELALCERYYEVNNAWWVGDTTAGGTYGAAFGWRTEKRASPTISTISQAGAANGGMNLRSTASLSARSFTALATPATPGQSSGFNDVYAASAEL